MKKMNELNFQLQLCIPKPRHCAILNVMCMCVRTVARMHTLPGDMAMYERTTQLCRLDSPIVGYACTIARRAE